MDLSYNDSVKQIHSMFNTFDTETIKTILTANNGQVEKTIEDLLKMTSDVDGQNPEDDNLFGEPTTKPKNVNKNDDLFGIDDEPQGNRFEDLGIFQEVNKNPKQQLNSFGGDGFENFGADTNYAKDLQEQEDAAIAYRLQKEFMQQDQEVEQQAKVQRTNKNTQQVPVSETWDFSHPSNQRNPQNVRPNEQRDSGDKKKPDILNKVKSSFNNFGNSVTSLFNKKKPAAGGKNQPANPGFSDIDNLDEQEVYNFSAAGNPREASGLHQLSSFQTKNNSDPALHLSDVLHSNASTSQNSGYENYSQQRNSGKNEAISNEYFDFS